MSVVCEIESQSDPGIARKLKNVLRNLNPLEEQGRIVGFLKNADDAQKLNGLVEDIRDAIMDYLVCTSNPILTSHLMFTPDFITTRYLCQWPSVDCESYSLMIRVCVVTWNRKQWTSAS